MTPVPNTVLRHSQFHFLAHAFGIIPDFSRGSIAKADALYDRWVAEGKAKPRHRDENGDSWYALTEDFEDRCRRMNADEPRARSGAA